MAGLVLGAAGLFAVPFELSPVELAAPTDAASAFERPTSANPGAVSVSYPSGITISATSTGLSGPDSFFSGPTLFGAPSWGFNPADYTPVPPANSPGFQLNVLHRCTAYGLCTTPTRTVTFTFSQPVLNPRMHFQEFGGYAAGGPTLNSVSNLLKVTTPGITPVVISGRNLQVTGGDTIETASKVMNVNCGAGNPAPPGCGTVELRGLVSSVTMDVRTFLELRAGPADPFVPNPMDGFPITFTLPQDYGDAPASYDAGDAARAVMSGVTLGAAVTEDNASVPNSAVSPISSAAADADGADDGATFGPITTATTDYSVPVAITGATTGGTVCGWIDTDRDGAFQLDERACSTYPAGATSATLTWSLAGLTEGETFARLRIGPNAAQVESPTGAADSGEVEDHRLVIDPVVASVDLGVVKTGPATVSPSGTVEWEITVHNHGPDASTGFVLEDVVPAGYTGVATSTPGCSVVGSTLTCSGGALAAGDEVVIALSATAPGTSGCLTNTAAVVGNETDPNPDNDTSSSETCVTVASLSIDKEVVGSPVQNGDGTVTVEYDVTVTSTGAASTTYDLDDELAFGEGITVEAATVSNTAPGNIVTNTAWDGQGQTLIVTGQDIEVGDAHVFRVTVDARVATTLTLEAGDCAIAGDEQGTGFLNSATVTHNGRQQDDDACGSPGRVRIDKEVLGVPERSADGSWTVRYTIEVANDGATDATYDLEDELAFGAGVAVRSATVANVDPGDIVTDPSWDGVEALTVVSDQALPAGAQHLYEVTVVAVVGAGATEIALDCALDAGEDGTGFLNRARVTVDGAELGDEDCTSPERPPGPPPITPPPTRPQHPAQPITPDRSVIDRLAHTGAALGTLLTLGMVLLVAGSLLVAGRRRRGLAR